MPPADFGIAGKFSRPDGGGPFPGVLAIGGSDGGGPEYFLNLLVPEGFAVLALAYWGTQTQLSVLNIPLERVEHGLLWLRDQASVRADRLRRIQRRRTRAPLGRNLPGFDRPGRGVHAK
jgi:hypothetical protein